MDPYKTKYYSRKNGSGIEDRKFMTKTIDLYHRNKDVVPRRDVRFKVLDGTYVSFGSRKDQGFGFIKEISNSGLSFEYFPINKTFKSNGKIDIILDEKNVRIGKVPYKKIYERALENEDYTPVQMYQVGLKFGELKSKHINNLVHLISKLNEEI